MKTKVIKAYLRRQIAKNQEIYDVKAREAYEDVLEFIKEAQKKKKSRTIWDVMKERVYR